MDLTLQNLNRDIINKNANGKTIWQPRIGCWYDDRLYRNEELPGKYKGSDLKGIYEKIGCSDRLYHFNECYESKIDVSVVWSCKEISHKTWEYKACTPVGNIMSITCGNDSNPGVMPKKWWITNKEDLKVYTYIEEATTYSFNMQTYNKLYEKLGHLGLPAIFLPRTNIQRLFIDLCGVEDAIYLLTDSEDLVETYFKALSKSQETLLNAVAASPIEWVNYGDNLHCKLLPPNLFKKYIIPEYEKRGHILHKANKFTYSHWDGDVKDFLPFVKDCALDGIEAITPLPQGDVTLEETKKALGNDIFLIDGIASILFNETYPFNELKEQAEKVLNLFEGQLILGISDEFPSDGIIERLEYVNEIVNNFNALH